MGLVASRLNFDSLSSGRRRSQQDEPLYSYSLNKNYFSNYFLMGGERFEVNDPDYLFGDHCDLNFLSCTKPCSLPYKQAQQNLLLNLSKKQKSINKTISRANRLGSPFSILTARRRQLSNPSKANIESQQQESDAVAIKTGSDASQPLVMLINIRKETLRLIKSSNVCNLDSDLNSLTNSVTTINTATAERATASCKRSPSRQSKKSLTQQSSNTYSPSDCQASASTSRSNGHWNSEPHCDESSRLNDADPDDRKVESEFGSLVSASSVIRGGYVSVASGRKCSPNHSSDDDQEKADTRAGPGADDDDDDDDFKDALNDTTNFSLPDDDISDKVQQQKSLLGESTKENLDIRITIGPPDATTSSSKIRSDSQQTELLSTSIANRNGEKSATSTMKSVKKGRFSYTSGGKRSSISSISKKGNKSLTTKTTEFTKMDNAASKVYHIEFEFDAEVDCSIRIYYFCTRELNSSGVTYKPQHATYKSKVYNYKRGLNQKFEHLEHTFQPYLFDEDLLIYKPLDLDGNYNSGAVFPIVIHCVALEGPLPRQSQSLVATIEKSQLDESYSIKPLKQLIFVDGVQYILQDIYGIEHKPLTSYASSGKTKSRSSSRVKTKSRDKASASRAKINGSINSSLDGSTMNLSETVSVASIDSFSSEVRQNRASVISGGGGNSVGATSRNNNDTSCECVVCMSEERDTMLLPCRHLCLCSSCAQSLRYQANSCPICRCPFKAALSLSYRGSQ